MTQPLPQVRRFPQLSYEVKMTIASVLIAPVALFGGWETGRVTDHRTDVAPSVIVVTETARAPETTSMTPTPKAGEREGVGRPVSRGPAVIPPRTTAPAPVVTRSPVPTKAPPSETTSVRTTSESPTSVPADQAGPSSTVQDPGDPSQEQPVHGEGDPHVGDPAGG